MCVFSALTVFPGAQLHRYDSSSTREIFLRKKKEKENPAGKQRTERAAFVVTVLETLRSVDKH